MSFHPLKPETLKRLAEQRARARMTRRAALRARLAEAAARDPRGIYAELLAEHTARAALQETGEDGA